MFTSAIKNTILGCLAVCSLIGCSSGSGNNVSDPAAELQLCVSSNCGSASDVVRIPDAENIFFTPEGRLFVTGDEIYEITRQADAFVATSIGSAPCAAEGVEFLGMARRGNVLYAACNSNPARLYAATLTATPAMVPIYDFVGMALPNGMATDNEGRLYVVNGPLVQPPLIARLTFDANDPFVVTSQETWLASDIESPNGIAFDGADFYITDSSFAGQPGLVKRVPLEADGRAGDVVTLFTGNGVLDDLSVVDANRLLVSDFSQGLIMLLAKDGTLLQQTDIATWRAASSVNIGKPPLFLTTDILVTDKGALGERASSNGNVLSVFRADP